MDYLERLEQSLDSLEKEADRLSGLPRLIKEIGNTADQLSEEKREMKELSHTIRLWSEDIERDLKGMGQTIEESQKHIDSIKKDQKKLSSMMIVAIIVAVISCGISIFGVIH